MSSPTRPRNVALVCAGALAVGAACGFWLFPATPEPVAPTAPTPPPRAAMAPPSMPPPRTSLPAQFVGMDTSAPVVVVSTPLDPAASAPVPETLARPSSPLDSVRQRVMEANPDLARFRQLQRKVLRKGQDTQSLQALFQDRQVIDAAKKDLLAEGETHFSDEARFRRLYQVEYLGTGLEWKDNPQRPTLFNDVEELLLADNIRPEMDLELRRSLAGDKVELFMVLLHNDRPRAEALLARVQGTRLGNLLTHARTRYDALWALANK